MKILSISNHELLPHLGSGQTRLRWTEGLRARGHHVMVLQPKDFDVLSGLGRAKKFRYAIGSLLKVWRLLRREEFDLIESYGDEFWLLTWALKMSRTSAVLVAHADGLELLDMEKERRFFNHRSPIKDAFFRLTHEQFSKIAFQYADKFVCGCLDDVRYAIEHGLFTSEEAVQIRPGVLEQFLTQEFRANKEKRIAFIGSWIDRKGIRVVPSVIGRVLNRHPDYSFHVFGSFGSADTIMASFDSGVRDRVIVHPKYPLPELIEQVKTCAIYFSPSYSEGFGLSTAEAMACSCAVVATRTGFCSELPPGIVALTDFDDVDGMAAAIGTLIEDEPRRLQLARAGFDWARQCRWDAQLDRLDQAYRGWADAPRDRSPRARP